MITPTGDLRPVLLAVIFENRTGTAIEPFDAPYGEPETTPRSCAVWAPARDGTAANATMATTTAARRVRVNICASEGWGTYESAWLSPPAGTRTLRHLSSETGKNVRTQVAISRMAAG